MEIYIKVTRKKTCVELDTDEVKAIVHHLKYMEENGFIFEDTPEMELLNGLSKLLGE